MKPYVENAAQMFPKDWIDKVDSISAHSIRRGKFVPMPGAKGEVHVSGLSRGGEFLGSGSQESAPYSHAAHRVAVHELAHLKEHVHPVLKEQQALYLKERQRPGHMFTTDSTTGGSGFSQVETYAKDDFADEYTGRIYGYIDRRKSPAANDYSPRMHYEVLTTAYEDLLTGLKSRYIKQDKHLEHFAFGMLVSH